MTEMQRLHDLDPVLLDGLDAVAEHEVSRQLLGQIMSDEVGAALVAAVPAQYHALRRRGRWAALVATAAVIAALAVALEAPGLGRGGVPRGSFSTTWQPSLPASTAPLAGPGNAGGGQFRLVSYLSTTRWREADKAGVPAGYLTCPSVSACYVTVETGEDVASAPVFGAVLFSGDGGANWGSLALPAHLRATAPLSCPSALVCASAGVVGGRRMFVSTTDGGHRWRVVPMLVAGNVQLLSCWSSSACSGLSVVRRTYVSLKVAGRGWRSVMFSALSAVDQDFVSTSDGGRTWSVRPFFAKYSVAALKCFSGGHCVAVGTGIVAPRATGLGHSQPALLPSGFTIVTANGGRRWSQGSLPAGALFGPIDSLSCPSESNCVEVNDTGLMALGPTPCEPSGCDGLMFSAALNLGVTTDGGNTWQAELGPSEQWVGHIFVPPGGDLVWEISGYTTSYDDLSCPTASECWLAGGYGILVSKNNMQTWSPQSIPSTNGVAQISCPEPGACVALGYLKAPPQFHAGSSRVVPVYSTIAPVIKQPARAAS